MKWTWTWTWAERQQQQEDGEKVSILARGFKKGKRHTTSTQQTGCECKKSTIRTERTHTNKYTLKTAQNRFDYTRCEALTYWNGMDWSHPALWLLATFVFAHAFTFVELNLDVYFTSFIQCPTRKIVTMKKSHFLTANRSNKTEMTYSLLVPARPLPHIHRGAKKSTNHPRKNKQQHTKHFAIFGSEKRYTLIHSVTNTCHSALQFIWLGSSQER